MLTVRGCDGGVVVLTSGSLVVYPSQGPCLIGPIVERSIEDRPLMFYQLLVLNDSGGKLFVPVDKVLTLGIRPLLDKSEIPRLLRQLRKRGESGCAWKERNINNLKLFASGSAFDLAEIVRCLTVQKQRKALSFREGKTLESAKRLLVSEISQVMGSSLTEAEERVDLAFQSRSESKAAPAHRKKTGQNPS
ncbi:MAG TPA: CarD family transcriptional regulator [Blastocatellia bacterium]|nr:CarD family transcriptional regulator [Blastocatellia bacterium]